MGYGRSVCSRVLEFTIYSLYVVEYLFFSYREGLKCILTNLKVFQEMGELHHDSR